MFFIDLVVRLCISSRYVHFCFFNIELRQLDLQRNQLTGIIPRSVGRLENLLYLNIKDNPSLGGRVPVQELGRLTKLNRLSLVHCNFSDGDAALEVLRESLPRCKIWI